MSTRFTRPNKETLHGLRTILHKILKPKRGVLSADESVDKIGKRLKQIGVKNTKDNRRCYRQILFTTDPCINKSISSVILSDEAVFQKADCGTRFTQLLQDKELVPGIRLDQGRTNIYGTNNETVAQGLDNLGDRLHMYKKEGCDFGKWRFTVNIGKHTPTPQAIKINANNLANFASICQANCMVPVLEPEVLNDGHHDLSGSQKVTETVLAAIIKALQDHHVSMENIILQPNMIRPGHDCKNKCKPQKIAQETVNTLTRVVPPSVPGIVFLSGGMGEEEATVALNNIIKCQGVKPWMLSFGYGRALQASVLKVWGGNKKHVEKAQQEFLRRAKANSDAACGKYKAGSVKGAASEVDLFAADH